jgi:hypothetical protein
MSVSDTCQTAVSVSPGLSRSLLIDRETWGIGIAIKLCEFALASFGGRLSGGYESGATRANRLPGAFNRLPTV